jgi:hypothetical protein
MPEPIASITCYAFKTTRLRLDIVLGLGLYYYSFTNTARSLIIKFGLTNRPLQGISGPCATDLCLHGIFGIGFTP